MAALTSAIDRDISGVGSGLHLNDPLSGNRAFGRSSPRALRGALCRSACDRRITKQGRHNYERGSYSILEENGCVIHLSLLARTLIPVRSWASSAAVEYLWYQRTSS